jgi:hypothetical protein
VYIIMLCMLIMRMGGWQDRYKVLLSLELGKIVVVCHVIVIQSLYYKIIIRMFCECSSLFESHTKLN